VDRPFFSHEEYSVRPGLHAPRQGNHPVVWWDPHTLNLQAPANLGLRQEEILSPREGAEPASAAYRRWQGERESVTAKAQEKQFDIFTASESLEKPAGFEIGIAHHSVPKVAGRTSGARFGTLVHAMLRDAGLDANGETLSEIAEVHGRLLGATDEETRHAVEAVLGALAHPLMERARRSARVRREVPVLLKLDGGRVLDGVIDLAFEAEGRWQVVDFKTDADVAANRARYERQLQWYGLAMAKLLSAPVDGHLLSL